MAITIHHQIMCNLYRMGSSPAEVAAMMQIPAVDGVNFASEIYPGYPGLVGTADTIRAMSWGFPLVLKSKKTGKPLKPKPVNNAREDKLSSAFWRDSFIHRRCLIPVTSWAEAEGMKGKMTRTWYSLPESEVFAVAGIWRPTTEWGEAYSMVMVDGHAQMSEVHDRMPTILAENKWSTWLNGQPDEAFSLCKTYTGELLVDRSKEAWAHRD